MNPRNPLKMWLAGSIGSLMVATVAAAPPPVVTDDPQAHEDAHGHAIVAEVSARSDPSAELAAHDAAVADIVSDAPFAKVTKNLAPAGRGERLVANATTDVWAHDGYAYTGTFNEPCGGDPQVSGSGMFTTRTSLNSSASSRRRRAAARTTCASRR